MLSGIPRKAMPSEQEAELVLDQDRRVDRRDAVLDIDRDLDLVRVERRQREISHGVGADSDARMVHIEPLI